MKKRRNGQRREEINRNSNKPRRSSRNLGSQLWESLVSLDEKWTATISVCAHKGSTLAYLRPLMKFVEFCFHGVLWLIGTLVVFLFSHRVQDIEITVNLFFILILDLIIVGLTKVIFRRSRPLHNQMDMFGTVSVDMYSFPSGHATRAAMLTIFFINNIVSLQAAPFIITFCIFVGMTRILLGRHHISDVVFGFVIGILEYLLYLQLWLPGYELEGWLDDFFGHIHL